MLNVVPTGAIDTITVESTQKEMESNSNISLPKLTEMNAVLHKNSCKSFQANRKQIAQ